MFAKRISRLSAVPSLTRTPVPPLLPAKSHGINLFADPPLLTPNASIFYENTGRGGGALRRPNASYPSKLFRCNTYVPPVNVANKGLTEGLSPLDATLTKNTGGGVPSFPARLSFQAHTCDRLSPYPLFFSCSYALICGFLHSSKIQSLCFQAVPNSFTENMGWWG